MKEEQCWLNLHQAAQHINTSEAFIRKSVRNRKIPFVRVGGKILRFNQAELDYWLQSTGSGGELHYTKK